VHDGVLALDGAEDVMFPAHVAVDQGHPGAAQAVKVPPGQVVQDGDLVAAGDEPLDQRCPDEPRPARDQYPAHLASSRLSRAGFQNSVSTRSAS
jgi:hypothetical protein